MTHVDSTMPPDQSAVPLTYPIPPILIGAITLFGSGVMIGVVRTSDQSLGLAGMASAAILLAGGALMTLFGCLIANENYKRLTNDAP